MIISIKKQKQKNKQKKLLLLLEITEEAQQSSLAQLADKSDFPASMREEAEQTGADRVGDGRAHGSAWPL